MIRGINFKIQNAYGSYLNDILNGMNIERYIWKIDDDQVFNKSNEINDGFLFETDLYDGIDFKNEISSKEYYAVSINLKGYYSENDFTEIKTYEDFINSNCEIIVAITDNIFVDIYAKDMNIIETIKSNAQDRNFTEIEYITAINDKWETI